MTAELLAALVGRRLEPAAREAFEGLAAALRAQGPEWLATGFASLPRKLGRRALPAGPAVAVGDGLILPGAFRVCDVAAADLLELARGLGPGPGFVTDLYFRGDAEERRMILRALALTAAEPASARLLVEAHRTNDQILFESGLLDSDLPARVLSDDDYDNAVLKAAFLDLDEGRLLGLERRASARLSARLLDLMSEREAAGRPAWPWTLAVASMAPVAGLAPRVAGALWHGRDALRLDAAHAAARLPVAAVRDALEARLPVEPKEEVRRAIAAALGAIDRAGTEG